MCACTYKVSLAKRHFVQRVDLERQKEDTEFMRQARAERGKAGRKKELRASCPETLDMLTQTCICEASHAKRHSIQEVYVERMKKESKT